MTMRMTAALGAALLLLIIGLSSVYTVQQTDQALVLQLGEPVGAPVTEPGLHFKVPLFQNVITFDKRVLNLDAAAEEVIAADQKRLVVDSFARYRIVNPLLFYQTVGNEAAANSRLGSIVNSSLRQALGSQPFQAMLSAGRSTLMRQISDLVSQEAKGFGIEIVDVRIRRADLPEANSQAIYKRMQTEREREAREFRAQGAEAGQRIRADADRQRSVILADARRQSEISRGEGDATAIRTFAEAFGKDPQFYAFYRSMQAYRTALASKTTTMVLSPSSDFFRFLDSLTGATGGKPGQQ